MWPFGRFLEDMYGRCGMNEGRLFGTYHRHLWVACWGLARLLCLHGSRAQRIVVEVFKTGMLTKHGYVARWFNPFYIAWGWPNVIWQGVKPILTDVRSFGIVTTIRSLCQVLPYGDIRPGKFLNSKFSSTLPVTIPPAACGGFMV